GHAHDAANALRHEIISGPRSRRAALAEACDRAIDQARIVGRQTFVIEAELDQAANLEVFDQHVGARGELLDDPLSLRSREVELNRALAAVGAVKIGGVEMAPLSARAKRRDPGASTVTPSRAFAFDPGRAAL